MGSDTEWYLIINSFARATPSLHGVLAAYALWGGLSVLAVLLMGRWWIARAAPDASQAVAVALLCGVSTVVALLVNQQLISPLIARARPCAVLAHVEVLLRCTIDYSMPSDHCVVAGAFTAGLWVLHRATGVIAAVLAVLLGFARVYVGVHYPFDTLVGLLVGAALATLIVIGLRQPTAAALARLTGTPLCPLILRRRRDPTH